MDLRSIISRAQFLAKQAVKYDGVTYLNGTPHDLTFGTGTDVEENYVFTVPKSDLLINAEPRTEEFEDTLDIKVIKTSFESNSDTKQLLYHLRRMGVVVVGSMIAMNAYPGLVYGVTPAKGYERVAPSEKRMNPKVFNIG